MFHFNNFKSKALSSTHIILLFFHIITFIIVYVMLCNRF